jgi:uncharacterized YccA/Bax inhibitor family protein
MMRSGNPALKDNTFLDLGSGTLVRNDAGAMSINGTVNKTALLLVITLAGALFTWSQFATAVAAGNPGAVMPYVWGGAIGGFVVALVTIFKKEWAMVTAPVYAVLEGLFLGAVSAMFEMRYPGIVMQAVGLTFGTLAALLMAYRSGLIKATENFKLGVVAATGGIALLYLVNIGMRLFGFDGMGFIHESSLMGIAFSGFVVVRWSSICAAPAAARSGWRCPCRRCPAPSRAPLRRSPHRCRCWRPAPGRGRRPGRRTGRR